MTLPVYLTFTVLPHARLHVSEHSALLDLCARAYGEDYTPYWRTLRGAVHVLMFAHGRLVSHAAWLDRALRQGGHPPLRTAYVEAVATEPDSQRRGFGSAVMRVVAEQVWDYELAALSSGLPEFYAPLGWEPWRGPLSIWGPHGPVATPGEGVLIRRTGRTPVWLDLDAPLSAEWRDAPDLW
jgi:aminoglycoside 2'-N-acetyltransferase I